jgi:hypothetical protein
MGKGMKRGINTVGKREMAIYIPPAPLACGANTLLDRHATRIRSLHASKNARLTSLNGGGGRIGVAKFSFVGLLVVATTS